jgi:hypothetical protein
LPFEAGQSGASGKGWDEPMLRLTDNPLARWPQGRALVEDIGDWWVARVKPRNEKVLALELAGLDVGYYLPMLLKRTARRDNGKPRKSVVCAFPGYLPVVGYPERREDILRSCRILKVLRVLDQERFARELESVRVALEWAAKIEVHPQLVAGQRMRILSGAMQGVEGVVLDMDRRDRLFLNVEMFQRAIVVRVSPDQVILAEDPHLRPIAGA